MTENNSEKKPKIGGKGKAKWREGTRFAFDSQKKSTQYLLLRKTSCDLNDIIKKLYFFLFLSLAYFIGMSFGLTAFNKMEDTFLPCF